jgi:hypothetical protein
MKKFLLLTLALLVGISAFTQNAKVSRQLMNTAVKTEYQKPISDLPELFMPVNQTVASHERAVNETTVGRTFYDLQSNSSLSNRLVTNPDGTMGCVWTMGMEATSFPDRGTGYNFWDGTAWGPEPTARIETIRTGWPAYAPWGAGEIVFSHNGLTSGAMGLEFCKRDVRGTGAWTETVVPGPENMADVTWPRTCTSGENHDVIHLLSCNDAAASYTGQAASMFYSRSTDGGATWDPNMVVMDGTGSEFYTEINADDYTMDSRDNVVAILVADAFRDLFYLKSVDNGENWEKVVVWENPYPFFDWNVTITDTFFCVDNSASIAVGPAPDYKVNIVFGINRVLHDVVGTSYSYFPYIDGIGFWQEGMPVFSNNIHALAGPQYGYEDSEMIENYNYIGWTQDVDGDGTITLVTTNLPMAYRELGLSTMPTVAVDDQGRVFAAWASTTETYDNVDYNFKKIWARAFENNEWGPFVHVTADIVHIFDESIYPQITAGNGNEVYVLYQADGTPGTALDADHDYQENRMIVAAVDKTDLLTGLGKENQLLNESSVSQNFPNPFNGTTTITVNLEKSANLSMVVTNMVGQQVQSFDRGQVSTGTYYFEVNGTNLPKGVYFYTVKADDSSITKKMIVR